MRNIDINKIVVSNKKDVKKLDFCASFFQR